jgi:hypothetical protein
MQLLSAAAKLELRLANDVHKDRNHPHEEQSEPAEPAGDHVRQLARLEILIPGLVPTDEDHGPTANEQRDTDVKRRSGRGFHDLSVPGGEEIVFA